MILDDIFTTVSFDALNADSVSLRACELLREVRGSTMGSGQMGAVLGT